MIRHLYKKNKKNPTYLPCCFQQCYLNHAYCFALFNSCQLVSEKEKQGKRRNRTYIPREVYMLSVPMTRKNKKCLQYRIKDFPTIEARSHLPVCMPICRCPQNTKIIRMKRRSVRGRNTMKMITKRVRISHLFQWTIRTIVVIRSLRTMTRPFKLVFARFLSHFYFYYCRIIIYRDGLIFTVFVNSKISQKKYSL